MRPLSFDFLGPEITALLLAQLAISPALIVPRDSGIRVGIPGAQRVRAFEEA